MHTSVVTLRPGNIVEIAKDVLRPSGWNCEWNVSSPQKPSPCKITLSSWDGYLKHLLQHSQHQSRGTTFSCRLPRCNIPAGLPINSYDELVTHFQHSHLNRVHLYCPVKDCASPSVSRPSLLEGHFLDCHPELVNQSITLPSNILLPSWRPYFPLSGDPPPLPTEVVPGSILVPAVAGTGPGQPRPRTPHLSDQRSEIMTLGSPKKRPRLSRSDNEGVIRENTLLTFDDLPNQLDTQGDYIRNINMDCIIRNQDPSLDVARPQPPLDPDVFVHKTPKISIHYASFAEKMEREGFKRTQQQSGSSNMAGPSSIISRSAN